MPGTDSAGVPWEGRSFHSHDTAFADDDGTMPTALETAMRALRERGSGLGAVVEALRGARLLVPLVAEAGDVGQTPERRVVDKTQELSIVTVAGPDGAPILPVFSSVAAMRSWNATARPVPADAQRVAAAALEQAGRVVVDPASWSEIVVQRPALEAILTGDAFTPAGEDATLADEIAELGRGVEGVAAAIAVPRDPQWRLAGPEIELVLVVADEAHGATARSGLGDLQLALQRHESVARRVSSMAIAVTVAPKD